jgi:hypothetical protein
MVGSPPLTTRGGRKETCGASSGTRSEPATGEEAIDLAVNYMKMYGYKVQ